MKVCLLYEDKERAESETYFDTASIIQDLGLKALFTAGAKKLIYENDEVKRVEPEDLYLSETLKSDMMIPLATKEEIDFRQEIVKDSVRHEDLIRGLYETSSETLKVWAELGRGPREKMASSNPVTKLITDIKVLHLFSDSLSKIKELLAEQDEELTSRGLIRFKSDFLEAFSDEREAFVKKVLEDVSFYTDGSDQEDEGKEMVVKPRIVLECGLEDGLKFSSLKLEDVSSESMKFYKIGNTMYKLREYKNSHIICI